MHLLSTFNLQANKESALLKQLEIKGYLPLYNGYHGTDFEFDFSMDFFSMERQNGFGNLFETYTEQAKITCSIVESWLVEAQFISAMVFEELIEPVNFEHGKNSSINVSYHLNIAHINRIAALMKKNKLHFQYFIQQKYPSRNNSIPSVQNSYEKWALLTNQFVEFPHYTLSIIFEFILEVVLKKEVGLLATETKNILFPQIDCFFSYQKQSKSA